MAWTAEKRRAAGERLKAGKLKKHTVTTSYSGTMSPSIAPEYDLMLGFKVIRSGNFHGLWELYRIEADGTSRQIGSATSKLLIMNMARNQVAMTSV